MQVKDLKKIKINELEEIMILSKLIDKDVKCMFDILPFVNMEYGQVIELKNLVKTKNILDIDLIQKISEYSKKKISIFEIEKSSIVSFFRTINEIEYNFKRINNYEMMLNSGTDSDLESAGISELNQFGDLNIIDTLAGGDILKWEKVLRLEWWDVFNKLLKDKTERDIQKRYTLIQQSKVK